MDTTPDNAQIKIARDAHFVGGNFQNIERQTVVNINNSHNNNEAVLKELKLETTPAAMHTSREVDGQGICTPGTRTRTLQHIRDLIASPDTSSPDLIWMHGPAGAGKSAIMHTTAQNLEKEGVLLASFFFFRSETRRNTSIHFIPTIAAQVSEKIPQAENLVAHSIRRNRSVFSQAPHLQCLHLLQTPLIDLLSSSDVQCGWTSTSPRVIVVDGLDECMDDGGQEKIITCLDQLTSTIRASTDCRVKILVASRPELRIKTEFEQLCNSDKVTVICLDSSDAELHLFYAERFAAIRRKYPNLEHWPSVDDLEWLMDKTSGQYSFADVSTRHFAEGDPVHRLQVIQRAFSDLESENNPFEALDALYAEVLKQLPSEMLQPALLVLRLLLGREPPWTRHSRFIVEPLLQLPRGSVSRIYPHLRSLINVDDDLRPYHATLADFLLNPQRLASFERFGLRIDEQGFRRTIIRGLFVPLASLGGPHPVQLSDDEIDGFSDLIIAAEYIEILSEPSTPCSYTSEEFVQLLKAVDIPQLDLWAASYLVWLCECATRDKLYVGRRNGLFIGASFWYTTALSVPLQVRAAWRTRLASYASCRPLPNIAEFAMGLVILFFELDEDATESYKGGEMHFRLLRRAIQASEEIHTIDATRGWDLANLLNFASRSAGIIVWAGVTRTQRDANILKYLHIVLRDLLRAEKSEGASSTVAAYVHCGGGHSTEVEGDDVLQCGNCSSNLAALREVVLETWSTSGYCRRQYLTLEILDTIYQYVQENAVPQRILDTMIQKLHVFVLMGWEDSTEPDPKKWMTMELYALLKEREGGEKK